MIILCVYIATCAVFLEIEKVEKATKAEYVFVYLNLYVQQIVFLVKKQH